MLGQICRKIVRFESSMLSAVTALTDGFIEQTLRIASATIGENATSVDSTLEVLKRRRDKLGQIVSEVRPK